jgi:hypothetical protein
VLVAVLVELLAHLETTEATQSLQALLLRVVVEDRLLRLLMLEMAVLVVVALGVLVLEMEGLGQQLKDLLVVTRLA